MEERERERERARERESWLLYLNYDMKDRVCFFTLIVMWREGERVGCFTSIVMGKR